jgi:hypothetical protein
MDKSGNLEYIFWLSSWGDRSISFWAKLGRFKCIITRSKISVTPVDNDPGKELNLDMSLIRAWKVFYISGSSNRAVELILDDRIVILSPINPFEPSLVLHVNHNEVSAMINIINAFRSNTHPEISTNPYLRQLAANNKHKGWGLNERQWERHASELNPHISPWDYYELYGERFLGPKVIAFGFLFVILATILVLGIAYVLDTLNII